MNELNENYISKFKDSILKDVREGLNAPEEFDEELIIHINAAIGVLNQIGVGQSIYVSGENETWGDLLNDKNLNNEIFSMIPSMIMLSTKIVFDPPPPSIVEYYKGYIQQLVWRLKVACETL